MGNTRALSAAITQSLEDGGLLEQPERDAVGRQLDLFEKHLRPDDLFRLFPNPATRPVLLAALLRELHWMSEDILQASAPDVAAETLQTRSTIAQILQKPYAPVFMKDILRTFAQAASTVDREDLQGWYKHELLTKGDGLNSTLRNLLLAVSLNDTVFRGTDKKAKIALGQYTWRELKAKVGEGEIPDLPKGTDDKPYVKFLVAVTDAENNVLEYMDYGQSEGQEKYGQHATGEGLGNIVGRPTARLIDPLDLPDVMRGLRAIEASQREPEDAEAVRRIGLHMRLKKTMVDAMESDDGRTFPSALSDVDDLTPEQMTMVFNWADTVKKMWGQNVHVEKGKLAIGEVGVVYPKFRGRIGLVRMDQPSTRTVTAATAALRALGMTPEPQSMGQSSRAKGEGRASEDTTLASHDISVVLARYQDFENDAAQIAATKKDKIPTRISLGGDVHHPTQTLAEVLLFMDHFRCATHTIEELFEKTAVAPPTIAFMGHTRRKRADRALIKFVAKHLPHWKIRIIVPKEEYLPTDLPASANIHTIVSNELMNDGPVADLTRDCAFLYVSNQEATSGSEGKGDGKKPADYHLSENVLEQNPNLRILHPLPASGELADNVFDHPHSLIAGQMQNKIAVITALVAHQLEAKEKRLKNEPQ